MRLAIICFTRKGAALCRKIMKKTEKTSYQWEGYSAKEVTGLTFVASLSQWMTEVFEKTDGIVFIGACGIAVRTVAPFIKDKMTDPAVVVLDEGGNFVISLLSGHMGGANALAMELAKIVGATPVITTATDVNNRFAVDVWAKKQDMWIGSMTAAKHISAAVLEGNQIGVKSDFPVGNLPEGFTETNDCNLGISISLDEKKQPFQETLALVPKIVFLGMGCRKGTPLEKIEALAMQVLTERHISIFAVQAVCSIDLKQEELGILEFCKKYGWHFVTFTKEELQKTEGIFSASSFVESKVGVDNVCERAAVLACGGKLLVQKTAKDGVTVAVAIKNWSVDFDE